MKRKLVEFKGTYYGYPLYYMIDTGKNKELREILELRFKEQLTGLPVTGFWSKVCDLFNRK
jgi:hypothetical protein